MMIRSVSADGILIGEQSFTQTIALTRDGLVEGFMPPPVADLVESHFELLFATQPELIVLGTGSHNIFPPRELMFAFARRSVGLEVMNTPAAARTFNILAGEGRRLAAVLYI
ncbi:MAG: hypothetical protein KAJ57_00215 [Woeseiaceae bacterium]|nr:hypothetical protein [Woeseiaceae bacterium]